MNRTIYGALVAGFIGGMLGPYAVQAAGELMASGLILTRTTETGFKFWARDKVNALPVASLQPTLNNSLIAFDVFPKGRPIERAGEGFAWADICDRDVESTSSNAVACARVGARSEAMEFGSRSFGGILPKAVWITMQGEPAIIIDRNGNTTITGQLFLTPAASLGPCNPQTETKIAYDKTRKQFYGCNGSTWMKLG